MPLLHPIAELEAALRFSARPLARAMQRLAIATLKNDDIERLAAREEMERLIGQTLEQTLLLGARRVLLEVDDARRRHSVRFTRERRLNEFARARTPMVDPVRFEEAIRDVLSRETRLANGYVEVQQLYAERHAFALAKSADLEVTMRVQRAIQEAFEKGQSVNDAQAVIATMGDWTNSYAEVVYRTNATNAYTAGRFAQAADPDVQEVFGGFEFVTAGDVDVRPNHAAAEGLIASVKDPIWDRFAPPMGYNCRCGLELVDRWELESRGLLRQGVVHVYHPPTFAAAHPDPGFGRGRPDRWLYAA